MTVTETEAVAMRRTMQVRKRNGDTEDVDVNKIVRAVERVAGDLTDVDPIRVATKTISGLYDGATTAELDRLSIQTSAEMISEEPGYISSESCSRSRPSAGIRRPPRRSRERRPRSAASRRDCSVELTVRRVTKKGTP